MLKSLELINQKNLYNHRWSQNKCAKNKVFSNKLENLGLVHPHPNSMSMFLPQRIGIDTYKKTSFKGSLDDELDIEIQTTQPYWQKDKSGNPQPKTEEDFEYLVKLFDELFQSLCEENIGLNDKTIENRKKSLFYIEGRKDRQFDSADIYNLANLESDEWKLAQNLLYIPERPTEKQFSANEIRAIVGNKNFKENQDIVRNIELDCEHIIKLLDMANTPGWDIAIKLAYFPERENCQLQFFEIKKMALICQIIQMNKMVKNKEMTPKDREIQLLEMGKANKDFPVSRISEQVEKGVNVYEQAVEILKLGKFFDEWPYWNDVIALALLDGKDFAKAKKMWNIPFNKEFESWSKEVVKIVKNCSDENTSFNTNGLITGSVSDFIRLIASKSVTCIKDAENICLNENIKEKYNDILGFSYKGKEASIMANMSITNGSNYDVISGLLKSLVVENDFGSNVAKSIDDYLNKNEALDIKKFTEYINSIDKNELEKISQNYKDYTFEQRLNFFDYHYKLGTTDFSIENMTLPSDLTMYLTQNYTDRVQLTELFYKYPATSRNVGEIPKSWLKNIPKEEQQDAKEKIYLAISDFQKKNYIEDFAQDLTDILGMEVGIRELNTGVFGTCYEISAEGEKSMCLKKFLLNPREKHPAHGQHIEVQTGLFVNEHSNDYVKMHFGKVSPEGFKDGFLVTEFLDGYTPPTENTNIKDGYSIICYDTSDGRNQIAGKIYDFGGIEVKKINNEMNDKTSQDVLQKSQNHPVGAYAAYFILSEGLVEKIDYYG